MGGARYLFANLDEGVVLAGPGQPEAIALRLTAVSDEVVLTLGDLGVVVAERDGTVTAGIVRTATATDTNSVYMM